MRRLPWYTRKAQNSIKKHKGTHIAVNKIIALWKRGCLGKFAVSCGALLILSVITSIVSPKHPAPAPAASAPLPTATVAVVEPAPLPTEAPAAAEAVTPEYARLAAPDATDAPAPTDVPTEAAPADQAPAPTDAAPPVEVPAPPAAAAPAVSGPVAPSGKDCPDAAPIKGNISKKGKLYHRPGEGSYSRTKPEACFATSADAEAAGYTYSAH